VPTIRIVGPGRAGRSLARALRSTGWTVLPLLGRHDGLSSAADGVDALVLAVPDGAIPEVAAGVRPDPRTVVLHLAGSLGPEVLAPHVRRAVLHPLVALPDPVTGSERLRSGVTFAVAGDPLAARMATALGGTTVEVPAHARAAYHAAATIAANHVVALLAQVERVARQAGVPLEAFVPLARAAVEDAGRLGPERALTGPVARGDWQTVERHVRAIDPDERAGYLAGVELARVVAATASRDGLAAVGAAGIA